MLSGAWAVVVGVAHVVLALQHSAAYAAPGRQRAMVDAISISNARLLIPIHHLV
jgi:hypothetical protein